MKNFPLALLLLFASISPIFSQQEVSWRSNTHEITMISVEGKESKLEIDPGFQYAEFENDDRIFRFFYNRDKQLVKHIRIMDEKTKLQTARGRGSWFWGNARLEFVDGERMKIKRKLNPNGYTITGPHGPVFLVENQKIGAAKTFNEKDLLTQAFFVFDRIKTTQKPPIDLVMIYSAYNSTW